MSRRAKGFTLLEILVAMFIFAILSAVVVSALHNITTQAERTKKAADRLSELQFAFIILSNDFEQILNRKIMTASGDEFAVFGSSQQVTFTHGGFSNPLNQLLHSSLQRTRYVLEKNNLTRITWPTLDYNNNTAPDKKVLLKNVLKIQFEYLTEKNLFVTTWPAAEKQFTLPKAIKISLVTKDYGTISQLYLIPAQTLEPPQPGEQGEPAE